MAKNSKFVLVEPNEDDKDFYGREWTNLGEINNKIEEMENNIPDKRTKEYEEFKTKVNFLIDLYNKNAHYKSFKKYE